MRADRLVATLLLLQAKGRVTAAEVAEELEISERTARRDLEALSMAGIPVYSQAGRGGGWSLLGGSRTDLSGLTAAEARTLFLVAGPGSSATPEAKSALRKLVQALPETFRADAEAAASAVMLDPASWGASPPTPPPFLDELQRAVVDGIQVELGYADRQGAETQRTISPLGLVQKGQIWYLVAGTDKGVRTFRVWRVRSVDRTATPVERPAGFDLAVTWAEVVAEMDQRRMAQGVEVLADADLVRQLRMHWGANLVVDEDAPPRPDGRVPATIAGPSWEVVVDQLAGYGGALEVLAPGEARDRLGQLGAELVARYRAGS
ncbi:WYL domain-containing protein [Iamia sp. SCSIO 61187]|uniref:helix-turn-helix transcriptional regulator n=1 Tax=Iamia sp. SCSIO 61187 TaxID=2722752 RepID=UPI001C626A65|nr:WYL domain-containing protein [Iamia sp. SCSIO 61187]QYG91417.1 WYL domain-containing protein [Iamia sp. SCSIO 61187]